MKVQAFGSYKVMPSRNGRQAGIPFCGFMEFPDVARRFLAPPLLSISTAHYLHSLSSTSTSTLAIQASRLLRA